MPSNLAINSPQLQEFLAQQSGFNLQHAKNLLAYRFNPLFMANVPSALTGMRRWVLWRLELVQNKTNGELRLSKPPYQTDGRLALPNDPSTWASFTEVVIAAKDSSKGFTGIGFMLGDGKNGLDIDETKTGNKEIDDENLERQIYYFNKLGGYRERSPSGMGCHIFVLGPKFSKGSKRYGLELYSDGRFFTITGDIGNMRQGPVEDRSDELGECFAELNPSKPRLVAAGGRRINGDGAHTEPTGGGGGEVVGPPHPIEPLHPDDRAIINKALGARNGEKFRELYAGRWEGLYPSQSEADSGFAFMLAYWAPANRSQAEHIFLASGLGQRDKARRQDYIKMTFDKAYAAPPLPRRGNGAGGQAGQFAPGQPNASMSPEDRAEADAAERYFRNQEASPEWQWRLKQEQASKAGQGQAGQPNDEPLWVWPPIGGIFSNFRPVPPFKAEFFLPPSLLAWIINEAERMPCLQEFIAAGALVMFGAVIGARCGIVPKNRVNWMIVPNLWGAIVGDPSSKKSPAWRAAKAPLRRLIKEEKKAYREALAKYETEMENYKDECNAVLKRIKTATKDEDEEALAEAKKEYAELKEKQPASPVCVRRLTNNATTPSLSELLRDNHNILLERDELSGAISDWDQEGNEADKAFMLEGWNGNQGYESDRIIRGHTDVDNACISVFGGLTTDSLTSCVVRANNVSNDGMLQRFQVLVCPDPRPWEWRNRYPDREAINKIFDLVKKLSTFDPVAFGAFIADDFHDFPYFQFDDEAHEIFKAWTNNLHSIVIKNEKNNIIKQHLEKYDKLFPALALIFHIIDCVIDGSRGQVTAKSARYAWIWCDYLEAHMRRCYGLLDNEGLKSAMILSVKLKQGAIYDGFTARDVRNNGWKWLITDNEIHAALTMLENNGWLHSEEVGGGRGKGRRTTKFYIHPDIIGEFEKAR